MRCRPGDLAVVIEAVNADNIGRIVEVVGPDNGKGKLRIEGAGPVWLVTCSQPLRWCWPNGKYAEATAGPVPDRCLQPIRGLNAPVPIAPEEALQ